MLFRSLPAGQTINGKLMELVNLLSTSEKLVLTIEDVAEAYIGSTMYLLTRDSDPTARQIRHTISGSVLSQLDPIEKYINYQLYQDRKTKVTDFFKITKMTTERAQISIGGLSLIYILVDVDSTGNLFTFKSIHKGAPDMIIKSTGTAKDPFFQIIFPSFKTIKKILIYTV